MAPDSMRLRDLIRAVRNCKTAAEERALIAKESAQLRAEFGDKDSTLRPRGVAKLMFMHMLGYPTHFGQMECLKLISSTSYVEKRMGYLGLMLLLDERAEVLMLVTNSIKNDLTHKNKYIVGVALCSLGNVASPEMSRDLAVDVEKLFQSSEAYIRKKAALCAIRIVRKVPDLAEGYYQSAPVLLRDRHHGVLLGGVLFALELCKLSEEAIPVFRREIPQLVKVLKALQQGGTSPEHEVSGISDPFLQTAILRLFRVLAKGDADSSDAISDILAQVASNTDASKNAGNAILYECVQTIMGVESIGSLRVLAINILGRFLGNKDNNIRYVALNTLTKVVAIDTGAVQRHRATIVDCVKDADVSIRRRALELVYGLVNEGNITTLSKELIEYLLVSDVEFKADLTNKICALVQKFAPERRWHLDTLIEVMRKAGTYVREEALRHFVVLCSNSPDLHGYTARQLFRALSEERTQPALSQVAVWVLGEYGEMCVSGEGRLEGEEPLSVAEADLAALLESLLRDHSASESLKAHIVTALVKLAGRLSPAVRPRLQGIIAQYQSSISLELQARAVEYGRLAQMTAILPSIVERIPALDEAALRAATGQEGAAEGSAAGPAIKAPAPGAAAPAQSALGDLLGGLDDAAPAAPSINAADALADLLGGVSAPVPSAAPAARQIVDPLGELFGGAPAAPGPAPVDPLAALMGGGAPPPQAAYGGMGGLGGLGAPAPAPMGGMGGLGMLGGAAPPPAPAAPAAGGLPPGTPPPIGPPTVAFQKNGVQVTFLVSKIPGQPPSTSLVTGQYSNASPAPVTDFLLQAAVPKFMTLTMGAATGSMLPPGNAGAVTQTITVNNTLYGQKPLVMRLKISYTQGGVPVNEEVTVNTFPPQA